jgi:tyrosyl-tRNA synthetase
VGDPTGRTSSRIQQSHDVRTANTEAIHAQLKRLGENVTALAEKHMDSLGHEDRLLELLNNDTWLKKTSIMEVLGTIGPGLRLGPMLGRDT